MRELRNLYWAKKNDVFGSSPVLLKRSEDKSRELESTLKEWLGENVYMRKTSESFVADPNTKPKPRYAVHAIILMYPNRCIITMLVWRGLNMEIGCINRDGNLL